jgi:GDSL-like Lipase/Acylhydrolase family
VGVIAYVKEIVMYFFSAEEQRSWGGRRLFGNDEWCPPRRTVPLLCLLFSLCSLTGCRLFKANSQVAFLGDSITQGWAYPAANFGLFGNTTSQMLERNSAILSGQSYAKVVILGGTNDVLLGIKPEITVGNLEKIGLAVQRSGAEPVLCEIPPIFHSFNPGDKKNYSNDVRNLNQQIARLAAEHRWKLADYYDPLLQHPQLSSDGVHIKRRGYLLMEIALLRVVPDA